MDEWLWGGILLGRSVQNLFSEIKAKSTERRIFASSRTIKVIY